MALRDAANVIGNQKNGALVAFFKRIGLKKGRGAAITATAPKLATILYKMVTEKVAYNPEIPDYIQEKINKKKLERAVVVANEMGLMVFDNQGFVYKLGGNLI